MGKVEEYRKRRDARLQSRLDADDEEGQWVTTRNGHKIHLNEEGEPDKGNLHVIAAMSGATENAAKSSGSGRKTVKFTLWGNKMELSKEAFEETMSNLERAVRNSGKDWKRFVKNNIHVENPEDSPV